MVENSAFPIAWDDPADAELTWEHDPMHCPQPLPPLSGDFMCAAIAGVNYRFRHFGLPLRVEARIFNGRFYVADRFDVPESERQAVIARSRESRRHLGRTMRRFWHETALPELRETYAWLDRAPVDAAPPDEAAALWDEAWQRLERAYALHFMTTAGSYQTIDDLVDAYESVVPGGKASDALALVAGLPNELQRVQRDLHALAEAAKAGPAVADAIVRGAGLETLPTADGGPAFLGALRAFLDAHGHLGQPFDDPRLPAWRDAPHLVAAEIPKRLLHETGDPEARRARLAAAAGRRLEEIRGALRDRPDDLARFDAALALAREVGPLTEGHNYWLDRMLQFHVRRFLLRAGARLVEMEAVSDPDDVFFLHRGEVRAALVKPRDARALVAARRAQLDGWREFEAPARLGKPPRTDDPPDRFWTPEPTGTDTGVLRGVGACSGTARGPARVVLGPADFARVQPGDILVCPSSNPSWVPLFGIIAGLVTDTGGVLSHAAVVAREFGVPAVVGTGDGTRRIRDGHHLEVDGAAGEVRIAG